MPTSFDKRGHNFDPLNQRVPSAYDIATQYEDLIKNETATLDTAEGVRNVLEWKEMWEQSPILKSVQKSFQYKELSQKGVAGAVGVLSRIALEAAFPAANFRDYATVLQTDEVPVKFHVRQKTRAYEVTSSGSTVLVTGPGSITTTVDAKTWKAEAEWDLEYAEDLPFPELAISTMEIGTACAVQEAQHGLDALHNILAADLAGAAEESTVSDADFLDMRKQILEENRTPSFLEFNAASERQVYTNASFKDKMIFGEILDIRRGAIGTFMGIDFFRSELNTTTALNTNEPMMGDGRFIVLVVRRDLTLSPYETKGTRGIWGTIRSGAGVLEKTAFARSAAWTS